MRTMRGQPGVSPVDLPARRRAENFPVALRALPSAQRRHLISIYDVARTIDELGDAATGDRSALLAEFSADLARVWDSTPHSEVLRRLVPTVEEAGLSREPFDKLMAANLADQVTSSYDTFEDLRDYCRLSADPIGHLVLAVFGVHDEPARELSDRICTALQVLEHLQDVAEDRRAGRVYLPAKDQASFGVTPADLDESTSSAALRQLLAFETDRAARLLAEGEPLLRGLHGWARLAVAGYVAGGWATVAALRAPGVDVLVATPRPRHSDVARTLAGLLVGRSPAPSAREAAYERCEQITRDEARNFYYGIRLLPRSKRSALCAVYALARRMDDIGDGELSLADKQQRLTELRTDLQGPADPGDQVLSAVQHAATRFAIPMGAFDELIDGMEMDLTGRHYETFEDLADYCRCVAGSVGRLCLGVFGSRCDPRASEYADALGIALQQTNILRDIREDLIAGRIYLPQEDLDRFGVELRLDETGSLQDPDGALTRLIRHSAARAQGWYDEGLQLIPLLDRRSAASAAAMAGIYRQLLARITQAPELVFDQRLSLSGKEKAGVAARALLGRQP